MKNCLKAIIILIFIASCKEGGIIEEKKLDSKNTISVKNSIGKTLHDSILDKNEFIRLETNSESIIGQIDKIVLTGKKIFVLDSRIAKALLVFDRKGKFLYKIEVKGKAPGEIMILYDFDIIETSKELIILDYHEVLYFDLDGNFKKEKRIKWAAENICVNNEQEIYLFINRNVSRDKFVDYHIIKTNKKFDKGQYFLEPIRKELFSPFRFQKFKDTVFFVTPQIGKYKIYKLVDNKMIPYKKFDFHRNTFIKDEYNDREISARKVHDNHASIINVFLLENHTVFSFSLNKKVYLGVNSEKTTVYGNKIDDYPFVRPIMFDVFNNELVSYIEAYHFKEFWNKHTSKSLRIFRDHLKNESFLNMVDSITSKDNPIIVVCKFNI